MLQDLANYDRLWEEACIEFVLSGKGSVELFCRLHNLQGEHRQSWEKNTKIIKYLKELSGTK